eukprot:Skav231846  [mRNA]  locus=scaffold2215:327874:331682:+ [translate_table: standard]
MNGRSDDEASGGEFRVGADEKGEEHYDLLLNAVHSYIKVTGAAQSEDGVEDAQSLNGIYVMGTEGFIPEYQQVNGKGRISFDPEESNWVIWSTFYGSGNYFYKTLYREDLELPEKEWEPMGAWEFEYSPVPTITKHELQVGQDVKLRKHHPDNHIGLFFAPKISPDQWIPLRAALPTSELEKLPSEEWEDDTPTRLTKKDKKAAKAKAPKASQAAAKEAAAGSGANAINAINAANSVKLLETLVEKFDNLEKEVKKLQG